MAKIVRYNGNLQAFASAAPGTERTIFGDVTQANDLTSQINADFLRGWGIVGPSDQPTLEDFNAVGYTHGQLLAYLHQAGVAEFDSAQEYFLGSVTQALGIVYVSLQNSNIGNTPSSSPSFWLSMAPNGRLLRTTVYSIIAGAQNVSVDGGAPTTSVATTFTPLPTTSFYEADVQGAGGSGGGTGSQAANTSAASGGGAAGSYAKARITNLSPQAITVGVGGAGAAPGTNGNSGSASSVGALVTAPGGGGSLVGTANTGFAVQGGTGQAASPTGGNILSIRGGQGYYSVQGALNSAIAGAGGSSMFGIGNAGPSVINTNGNPATNLGSGSSGAISGSSNPTGNSTQKGADGLVIIREYSA